jgi:hypothetical protein
MGLIAVLLHASLAFEAVAGAQTSSAPIPDIPALMLEVQAHQHSLDKIRENYTYKELQTTDTLDGSGQVKKTESEEDEVFFVNAHEIHRTVQRNGKPLSDKVEKKEQEHVQKEVEKAMKTPPDKSLDGQDVSISRILSIMKVSNARRVSLNGRSTIAFDFVGDPHAKTHGMAEDVSKKLQGTLWIDEKDREVTKLQVQFDDNFHIGAGLLASIQKGSSIVFLQGEVNHELWLPTSAEIHMGARVLLLKGFHFNIHVKDSDYQRFHADAAQQPGVSVVPKTN